MSTTDPVHNQPRQQQPVDTALNSNVLPKLEIILREGLSEAMTGKPEVFQQALISDLLGHITQTIKTMPIGTLEKRATPNEKLQHAAEMASEIAAVIITEGFVMGVPLSQNNREAFDKLIRDVFAKLVDPEHLFAQTEQSVIHQRISSGEWHELFAHELSYQHISDILAQTAIRISSSGTCFLATRSDLSEALLGLTEGSGSQFNLNTRWIKNTGSVPYPEVTSLIASIAADKFKKLPHHWSQRFTDLEQELELVVEQPTIRDYLTKTKFDYFPILFGSCYIGATYLVRKISDGDLNTQQKNNLTLATTFAAQAYARIARIRSTSTDLNEA